MRFWSKLTSPRKTNLPIPTTEQKVPRLTLPEMPAALYAVGDVHGCLSLYQDLEAQILADGALFLGPKLIVVLGDVVDRGPNSAGVLDHLQSPLPDGWQRLVLRGNHEAMMMKFLEAPGENRHWLAFGGDETLHSYGLSPDPELGFNLSAERLTQMIRATVPTDHINFLNTLPLCLEVGPYVLAHAGIDPRKPIATQTAHDLMWGDPSLIDGSEVDDGEPDIIVVHGHVPSPEVVVRPRRINVDTGAYGSGLLSAIRLETVPSAPLNCKIFTASLQMPDLA